MFQCSSASRKFLNSLPDPRASARLRGFSALQRAENSSIRTQIRTRLPLPAPVSVLFSEPKIPQFCTPPQSDCDNPTAFQCSSASRKFLNSHQSVSGSRCALVSVLFSEPKIPQSTISPTRSPRRSSFSALQRAENSSILRRLAARCSRR